jgi:transcriptional regulator with XRE-family HTH domain
MHYDSGTKPLQATLVEFGRHIERYRLSRNLRQADVAKAAGISRMTVGKLERGGGTIETLVRVLKALDLSDRLFDLIPNAQLSPLDPKTGSGENRQRARPQDDQNPDVPWTWGDE